jgi:hypothetical protein
MSNTERTHRAEDCGQEFVSSPPLFGTLPQLLSNYEEARRTETCGQGFVSFSAHVWHPLAEWGTYRQMNRVAASFLSVAFGFSVVCSYVRGICISEFWTDE